MSKILYSILLSLVTVTALQAQHLMGNLKQQAGQELKLVGYANFKETPLSTTTIDSLGNFVLNCPANYKGMGYLQTNKATLTMVLGEQAIQLQGTHLQEPDSIVFKNSEENNLFVQYAKQQAQSQNAWAVWKYLLPLYQKSPLLLKEKEIATTIQKEITRIENEDAQFLAALDAPSYVHWYLPLRKLISDMPATVMRYPERIPENIAHFRHINFNNPNFCHSGILEAVIEGHYLLLENMGQPLDSMYQQMNKSTDYILQNLEGNDVLLNDVSNYMFNLFEKRSLLKASEHLATEMLTQKSCVLDENIANKFEMYRKMKVGSLAPDIVFSTKNTTNLLSAAKLSELNNKYTLVVFGASWCPSCVEELPKIKTYYNAWKEKGLDVIFISLDTDNTLFTTFASIFPWLSYCDLKGWESEIVKDYHVFATPTLFLLDKNRKIVLHPTSAAHVNTWVNSKL